MKLGLSILTGSLETVRVSDIIPPFGSPNQLHSWMSKNIDYEWLDKNKVSHSDFTEWYDTAVIHPAEVTYVYKKGTCYENTILATHVFLRDFPEYPIQVLHFQAVDSVKHETISTHMFLVFEKDRGYYCFESSWSEKESLAIKFRSVDEIKDKHLQFYIRNNQNAELLWQDISPQSLLDRKFTAKEFYKLVKYDWSYSS